MPQNTPRRQLYLGPLTDNRRWDHVDLRPDDVIVVTPPKCGTTWMQTIVALLLSGDPEVETQLSVKMPWVDNRMRAISDVAGRLAAMQNRRSLKSHTPLDGLPLGEGGQYLCVFRHPLDAHFSFRNHAQNAPMPVFKMWYPEDDSTGQAFRWFLEGGPEGFDTDLMPLAHILRHYRAAKAVAERPNVTLFHYRDMQRDLAGTFDAVAALLGVSHPAPVMADLVAAAQFDNMQQNAERYSPSGGTGFFKSDAAFFHSGTSGKWHGKLTEAELAGYDAMMAAELSPEDRLWLENGAQPDD
ncbi:sulfotransferase domain-containing protein [Aliishimia ponticola]|uniref:Sulfotransferase domain-containing protein n=1 Tax=Aliishimia ponticola TaxID=2499833 RepID=A0A4S4NH05_9RHOB|nr:sulfotransferase domain-containing protein [Aliishimia ponticola]THH38919.1 sulfotransferase domain-containing protein [Aliishimia ponticola]